MSSTDETLNRSGSFKMSPTPFRGVMTLEETIQASPPVQGNTTSDAISNNPQDALMESGTAPTSTTVAPPSMSSHRELLRSRKAKSPHHVESKRHRRRRRHSKDFDTSTPSKPATWLGSKCNACVCACDRTFVRSTLSCMNLLARLLFWCSAMASVAAVVWYSYELKKHGTDPHLIAWFSAGAFVLLGFPISMYGIVMHLANYNQPNVQMYVVRILWMVPIYSIESWLCLRYKDYAIYIETLRDCYESYVLYSFLQFLIQVLGGEEALILMLKDKSPTRGVHMWGLQWCVKPWLMGQPLRKTYETAPFRGASAVAPATDASSPPRPLKRVHWTSPFFVKCKFGVLQYVLLKFLCSIVVMILERYRIYKEGNFTPKGGYLYICILTNVSQCWALYCLIFFYYATKNELSSIRPVGKFLSVKALVFFTWWQSVSISMLYQMDLIPHYHGGTGMGFTDGTSQNDDSILVESSSAILPLSAEDALALDEFGGSILSDSSQPSFFTATSSAYHSSTQQEWSAEDVAKGMQDYLICIEMFVAAIVHIFVFPHTEYDPQAVEARTRALNQTPHRDWNKRLGRKWKEWDNKSGWSGTTNTSSDALELALYPTTHTAVGTLGSINSFDDDDDLRIHPLDRLEESRDYSREEDEADEDDEHGEIKPLLVLNPNHSEANHSDNDDEAGSSSMYSLQSSVLREVDSSSDSGDDLEQHGPRNSSASSAATAPTRKTGFVRALLDSAIPQDLRDNTVGIIKGDYVVEKKTLLHHAATSDSYDLFSRVNKPQKKSTLIYSSQSIH